MLNEQSTNKYIEVILMYIIVCYLNLYHTCNKIQMKIDIFIHMFFTLGIQFFILIVEELI